MVEGSLSNQETKLAWVIKGMLYIGVTPSGESFVAT
jgi:hypothetical protein